MGEETRKKVLKIIGESNYLPSATARSLSKQESYTIGVLIPEADNAFFGEILKGISEVVDANNLTMIFCNTDNNQEKDLRALQMFAEQRVGGLIMTPASDYCGLLEAAKLRKAIDNLKVPVVLVDRRVENSQWDGIFFDNFNGAYKAAEALIKEGHEKIGVITGNLKLLLGRERFNGYKQAFYDYGLPLDNSYIYKGDFTTQTAYKITKDMIASGDLPDAIFLSNNLTAIGFLKAIFEEKFQLSRDICCIGFDKVEALNILNINYSYIERDAVNMGRMTIQMLLDRMANPSLPRREYIIPATLVLNGSEKRI